MNAFTDAAQMTRKLMQLIERHQKDANAKDAPKFDGNGREAASAEMLNTRNQQVGVESGRMFLVQTRREDCSSLGFLIQNCCFLAYLKCASKFLDSSRSDLHCK